MRFLTISIFFYIVFAPPIFAQDDSINEEYRNTESIKGLTIEDYKKELSVREENLIRDSISMIPGNLLFQDISTMEIFETIQENSFFYIDVNWCSELEIKNNLECEDNRKEYNEIGNDMIKNHCNIISYIISKEDIEQKDEKTFILRSITLKNKENLCNSSRERFLEQPVVRNSCFTGFAISDSLIVTAKHGFDNIRIKNARFIFNFYKDKEEIIKTEFDESEIYTGEEYKLIPELDIAIIKLNRKIQNFKQTFDYLSESDFLPTDSFYVLGHPFGLPLKLCQKIRFFEASKSIDVNNKTILLKADTYSGNSGSPVFNYRTHKIVGVFLRGQKDIDEKIQALEDCNRIRVCRNNDCEPEEALKMNLLLEYLR